MEQLGHHWADFHDILRLNIFFRKYIDKIQVSLKSPNNGYFTQSCMHIYDSNSLDPFLE